MYTISGHLVFCLRLFSNVYTHTHTPSPPASLGVCTRLTLTAKRVRLLQRSSRWFSVNSWGTKTTRSKVCTQRLVQLLVSQVFSGDVSVVPVLVSVPLSAVYGCHLDFFFSLNLVHSLICVSCLFTPVDVTPPILTLFK